MSNLGAKKNGNMNPTLVNNTTNSNTGNTGIKSKGGNIKSTGTGEVTTASTSKVKDMNSAVDQEKQIDMNKRQEKEKDSSHPLEESNKNSNVKSSSARSSSAPPTEHVTNVSLGNKQPNTSTYRNQQYVPINTTASNATGSIPIHEYQKKITKEEIEATQSQGHVQTKTNLSHNATQPDVQMQNSYQHGGYNPSMRGGRHHGGRGGGRTGPSMPHAPYQFYQQQAMQYYGSMYTPQMHYVPNYAMHSGAYPQTQTNPPYMMSDANRLRGVSSASGVAGTGEQRAPSSFTPKPKKVLDIINPKTKEKVIIEKPKTTVASTSNMPAEKDENLAVDNNLKAQTKVLEHKEPSPSKISSPSSKTLKKEKNETIIFGDIAVSKIPTEEKPSTSSVTQSDIASKVMSPRKETKKQQPKMHIVSPKKAPITKVESPKPSTTTLPSNNETKPNEKIVANNDTPTKAVTPPEAPKDNVYPVDFLLALRDNYMKLCLNEGEEWPCMEIINDGPVRRSGRGSNWNKSSSGGGREWSRSQKGRGGRGGGGGASSKRSRNLNRSNDRWVARKAVSNLEACKKLVQGILNKMTREKFDPLSTQLCEMKMESLQMLREVIKLIFAKAINEPHFCDMYADLCAKLQDVWKVWGFLQVAQDDDEDDKFFWTTITDKDAEVIGPFADTDEILDNIENGDLIPTEAPENLVLDDLHVRDGYLIKIWKQSDSTKDTNESSVILYWSREKVDSLEGDNALYGPFPTREEARDSATKTTAFKRILLNSCQEEFEKDNIYEELEKATAEKKEKGELTTEMEEEVEEKKHILKFRMLGNIRFIGELYKKGILQERIMHTCIMKLLDLKFVALKNPKTNSLHQSIVPIDKPSVDEEKLESCSKLLTTIGKTLDSASQISNALMSKYFEYIAAMSVDKKYSSRIRFTLQDLIDLRTNRWQPRRKELQQKKLSEIRKDQEKEQKVAANMAAAAAAKDMGGYRGNRFNSSLRGNTGSGLGGYHRNDRMDQGGRGANNSKMGANTNSRSNLNLSKEKSLVGNKDVGKLSSSTEKQQFKPNSGFSSMSSRKGTLLNSARKLSETKSETPLSTENSDSQITLSEDDKKKLESLFKSNVEEFNSSKDKEEMFKCLQGIFERYKSADVQQVYMHFGFQWAMEKSRSNQREAYLHYINTLYNENFIAEDVIADCFCRYMLEGTDLWVDIPKMHENIAHFIYRLGQKEGSVFNLEWIVTGGKGSLSHEDITYITEESLLRDIIAVYLCDLHKNSNRNEIKTVIENLVEGIFSVCRTRDPYGEGLRTWMKKHQLQDIFGNVITKDLDHLTQLIDQGKIDDAITYYSTSVTDETKENLLFMIPLFYTLLDGSSLSISFLQKMNLKKSMETYIIALMIYRYYADGNINTVCEKIHEILKQLIDAKLLITLQDLNPSFVEAQLKKYISTENEIQELLKILKK